MNVVVTYGANEPRPPCAVCGTPYEKHGSYPTCASHHYSPTPAAAAPDMLAVCAALGFDPTNHHNAAKCPYCAPAAAAEVPTGVLAAVERMSTPLHESRLAGATAIEDARCMKIIADFIASLAAPNPERCRLLDELIASWCEIGNSPAQCERRIQARAAVESAWPMLAASPVAPAGVPSGSISGNPAFSLPSVAKAMEDAVLSAGAPAVPLQDEQDSSSSHLAARDSTVPSALTVGTPPSELSDAALIDAFIAHNEQFSRSSDHPAWLHCKDGDGNSTSLRGDWFAAALRNVLTGEQA